MFLGTSNRTGGDFLKRSCEGIFCSNVNNSAAATGRRFCSAASGRLAGSGGIPQLSVRTRLPGLLHVGINGLSAKARGNTATKGMRICVNTRKVRIRS